MLVTLPVAAADYSAVHVAECLFGIFSLYEALTGKYTFLNLTGIWERNKWRTFPSIM